MLRKIFMDIKFKDKRGQYVCKIDFISYTDVPDIKLVELIDLG